jgi:hypothetical protein
MSVMKTLVCAVLAIAAQAAGAAHSEPLVHDWLSQRRVWRTSYTIEPG